MRKLGLNTTRERIHQFIHSFIDERGYSPTVRDILKGCEISSTAVVQYHLDVLEKSGRIHRDPEVFRSIRLSEKKNTIMVPLLGTIAAGEPIPVPNSDTWTNQAAETLEIPQDMVGNKQVYALKVKGQSMIDALIDDGDIVLMEQADSAENGEMVAVWLKDRQEVTLKRIYVETDSVLLKPANQYLKPIQQNPDNVEIQGKVIGVIRKL
ncbi:MAG: transcriptional repressor LexA [Dehalococcoidales bacterium]|nr:transcriptional repressor LexA [Dehalococcoidales bacterium]